MATFDIDSARKAGYSDDDIVGHLAAKSGFDADGAKKAGYTNEQIIAKLTAPQGMPEPAQPQGFGAQLSRSISDIPRQVGLTARHGIEGLSQMVGVLSDPIAVGMNAVGVRTPNAAQTGKYLADSIGLPTPANATERIAGDAAKFMAGGGGMIKGARVASNALTGTARDVATMLAKSPGVQTAAAAGAGTAGGYTRETGGNEWAQFVASLAGGISAGGAAAAAKQIGGKVASLLTRTAAPVTDQTIDITLQTIAEQNGVRLQDIGAQARASLRQEVRQAMNQGPLNPEATVRLIDYRTVGATPARGNLTLNPADVTRQKNLAKIGANSSDADLQALAMQENLNGRTLISGLDELGARNAPSAMDVGARAIWAVAGRDARMAGIENRLYDRARQSAGRDVPLDRSFFGNRVDELLAADNKHAFLPEQIRGLVNQVSKGQINVGGSTYEVPFNVNAIDQLKTTLATAQRGAQDGNVRRSIGLVRQALEETPIQSGGQAAELPQSAMNAFNRARAFARTRRKWQESAPAIQDALDGIPPDRFVQNYIIGNTDKASAGNVQLLRQELDRSGATPQVRQYIADFLKQRAIGSSPEEAGNFSAANFNKALESIGDAKLSQFFNQRELAQLRSIGRVAQYESVQPRGSAVNNSNTAAMAFGRFVDAISSSRALGSIPFADALLRAPAKNISASIQMRNVSNLPRAIVSAPAPVQQNLISRPPGLLMLPLATQER
jgi:hypothetical protein